MPPSMYSVVNESAISQKIEIKKKEGVKVSMATQLVTDEYNVMNLGSGKNPVLKGWDSLDSKHLAEAFDSQNKRISMRLGEQLNGRYIVSIDFDNFGKKDAEGNRWECPATIAIYEEYIANNRKDGMFSSSTEGNFNVLVDVTDVPEIYEMCSQYPKNHWDYECVQFLVRQTAQQVIPPTATENKRTGTLGKPRQFLTDMKVYEMTPEDTFMIQFFKKYYKPEKLKKVIKSTPIRSAKQAEQPAEDEWTELLFNVIKNDSLGNQYAVSYERWQGIGTILKHNNYPFAVFKKWHMMCLMNRDDGSAERYWGSIKGDGFSIYALQGIAKKINPEGYKVWFVKHKKFISLKVLSKGENDVAKFMTPIMREHLVFTGLLWYRNDGRLWLPSKEAPVATIANQLQKIIDLSRETLLAKKNATEDEVEKQKCEDILKGYGILYKVCGGSGFTAHIARMFKEYLFDDKFEDKINQNKYQVVYQDGVYDMLTKTFRKGIFPYEYITKTLPYDYEKGDPEVKKQIIKALKRICNNKDHQLKYYLSTFGYALTADASKEQVMWYMCGQSAQNGKSSVLEALTKILPIYVKGESRDNFYKNDTKLHKAVGTWRGIRILWVNELENDKKVNEALFKASCDGTAIPFSKHYGENETMPISFKLFLVSNFEFNISMDEGVKRRFKHEQFNTKFDLEEGAEEDEVKCRFIKNANFGDWLVENKHSLLEVIYEYSHQYATTGKLPTCPPEWEAKKQETIANLNVFEENLRAVCVLGESETGWNDELCEALECESKNIGTELKRLGLYHKYESQFRKNGRKGLHRGLRLKKPEELEADQAERDRVLAEANSVVAEANINPEGDPDAEYR